MSKPMPKNKFTKYFAMAVNKCHSMSFQEKSSGIWTKPEVIKYLSHLPTENAHKHIFKTIFKVLIKNKEQNILVIGGGTGKLGNYILLKNKKWFVTEIDSSGKMVKEANEIASKLGLTSRYISRQANAKKIPFKSKSFDIVIAYGVFRYLLPEDQKIVVSEINRVSKMHILISEGKAKDIIYEIMNKYCIDFKLTETKMKMFRVTLFYMLLSLYKTNKKFKELINVENTIDPIDELSKLAGISDGILYELLK